MKSGQYLAGKEGQGGFQGALGSLVRCSEDSITREKAIIRASKSRSTAKVGYRVLSLLHAPGEIAMRSARALVGRSHRLEPGRYVPMRLSDDYRYHIFILFAGPAEQ
jgi:hypothetical protein